MSDKVHPNTATTPDERLELAQERKAQTPVFFILETAKVRALKTKDQAVEEAKRAARANPGVSITVVQSIFTMSTMPNPVDVVEYKDV